jgi:hypothetical protein
VPYDASSRRCIVVPKPCSTVQVAYQEDCMDVYEPPIVIASFESNALLGEALAAQVGSIFT